MPAFWTDLLWTSVGVRQIGSLGQQGKLTESERGGAEDIEYSLDERRAASYDVRPERISCEHMTLVEVRHRLAQNGDGIFTRLRP